MSKPAAILNRFQADSFEPASFRERGATVPFTTPLLLNARIRAVASGRGFEMVVPNPSGGRGALILPWSSMLEICSPTLFDRHLWESLATSNDISPIGIRIEAQRLAASGLAGRQTALMAKNAQRREKESRRVIRGKLAASLIAASDASYKAARRSPAEDERLLSQGDEGAVARAAAMAGMSLSDFTADLEYLALTLSGVTPELKGVDARVRQMLAELKRVVDEITEWIAQEPQEAAHVKAANFVAISARQTLQCGEVALAQAEALMADLGLLIPKWQKEKQAIFERARRPDWVLDGWKIPLALWLGAELRQRRAAIWEMALIAPVLPREGKAWLSASSEFLDTPPRVIQIVRKKSDWRSGNLMELVGRNENLIGSSIALENRISPLVIQKRKVIVERFKGDNRALNQASTNKNSSESSQGTSGRAENAPTKLPGKSSKLSETRSLGGMIEVASDKALVKIVALVDRLGKPEVHEALLRPSLRRLKRLRPARPANLLRLLFIPLAGALVDPLHWKRTGGRIPRSALAPFLEGLTPVLGSHVEVITSQLRGANLDEEKLVDRVGRQLWEAAALAVPRLHYGATWSKIGFTRSDFDTITALAGALWRHAGPLWDGLKQIAGPCHPEGLRSALIGPANESNSVFAAALNTLLQRAAYPSNFISLFQDLPVLVTPVVETILNNWVNETLPALWEEDFATGAHLAREVGMVILALEDLPRITARTDARELVSYRRNLDQFCNATYREVVWVHVIQALLELSAEDIAGLDQIETMARIGRSLEDAGRRFGSPKTYEDLQDEFRAQMEKHLKENPQSVVGSLEVARIKDILIGQEAAERFIFRPRVQRLKSQ
jgi:hypothetical protein